MNYVDLGKKIRQVRRQKSMTQEQLAEKAGISASFLGHIERGTRIASLETLIELCNTLQVSPDYLLSASLNADDLYPTSLSTNDKAKLSEFLRLAQDAVQQLEPIREDKMMRGRGLFLQKSPLPRAPSRKDYEGETLGERPLL